MLHITIPGTELWDAKKQEFVYTKERTLQLEHSLVSISKWEQKWKKPFLSKDTKTFEESIDYIRCMTITQNVDPKVYENLTNKNLEEIFAYIDEPMTATTVRELPTSKRNAEIVTAELIYYWMFELKIPMECQKWHLNRLLTQIKVVNIKNTPPKKMSRSEIMRRNAALNEKRRKQLNTRG